MSSEGIMAVIPCRQGSKRFPHKNTALFQGVPLVQNTIRIAKEAGIEKILVTTDDVDVMTIAAAESVKYLNRPEDLCTDDAPTGSVVENAVHYAVGEYSELKWDIHTICLLQVTSPALNPVNLQIALDRYFKVKATSLTAINSRYKPCGAFYIVDKGLFMRDGSFYQSGGGVCMLPEHQQIDVDHHYDLFIANAVDSGRSV